MITEKTEYKIIKKMYNEFIELFELYKEISTPTTDGFFALYSHQIDEIFQKNCPDLFKEDK